MTMLRFLNIQGMIGIGVALILGLLLVMQKSETRQWKEKAGQFELLHAQEQAAHAGTVANYRAAAEQARAADAANKARVEAEQRAINERSSHDLQTRLADARARAERLQQQARAAAANPGGSGTAPVPGLPDAAGGPDEAAGQGRLPADDALIATEQAIQLDELIKWVRRQAGVKVDDGAKPARQ